MKKYSNSIGVLAILVFFALIFIVGLTNSKIEDIEVKRKEYKTDKKLDDNGDNQLLYLSGNDVIYEDKESEEIIGLSFKKGYKYDEYDDIKLYKVNDKVKGVIVNYNCIGNMMNGNIEVGENEDFYKVYTTSYYFNIEDKKMYFENEYVYIYYEDEKMYGIKYEEAIFNEDNELVDRVTTYDISDLNNKKEIKRYDGEHYEKVATSKGDYYLKHYNGGTDSPSDTYEVYRNEEKVFEGIQNMTYVISDNGSLYYVKDGLYVMPYGEKVEKIDKFDKVNEISVSDNNNKIYASGIKDNKLIVYNVSDDKVFTIADDLEEGYRFTMTAEPYQINTPYDMYIHIGIDDKDYCMEYFFNERNNKIQEFKSNCWGTLYEEKN